MDSNKQISNTVRGMDTPENTIIIDNLSSLKKIQNFIKDFFNIIFYPILNLFPKKITKSKNDKVNEEANKILNPFKEVDVTSYFTKNNENSKENFLGKILINSPANQPKIISPDKKTKKNSPKKKEISTTPNLIKKKKPKIQKKKVRHKFIPSIKPKTPYDTRKLIFTKKRVDTLKQKVKENLPLNTKNLVIIAKAGLNLFYSERNNPCFAMVSILGALEFLSADFKNLFKEFYEKRNGNLIIRGVYAIIKKLMHSSILNENSHLKDYYSNEDGSSPLFGKYLNDFAKATYTNNKELKTAEENVEKHLYWINRFTKKVKNYETKLSRYQRKKVPLKYQNKIDKYQEKIESRKEKIQKHSEKLKIAKENKYLTNFENFKNKLKPYFDKIDKLNETLKPLTEKQRKKFKKAKIFSSNDLEKIFEILIYQKTVK